MIMKIKGNEDHRNSMCFIKMQFNQQTDFNCMFLLEISKKYFPMNDIIRVFCVEGENSSFHSFFGKFDKKESENVQTS